MIDNFIYIIAIAGAWLAAQAIKVTISPRPNGLSWQDLVASGGMPSAHAAMVTSVGAVIALSEGMSSPIFGVILTLGAVVIYDSVGVRRATGENTQIIRQISGKLKLGDYGAASNLALGHTPYQAFAGFILGLGWGLPTYWLLG